MWFPGGGKCIANAGYKTSEKRGANRNHREQSWVSLSDILDSSLVQECKVGFIFSELFTLKMANFVAYKVSQLLKESPY